MPGLFRFQVVLEMKGNRVKKIKSKTIAFFGIAMAMELVAVFFIPIPMISIIFMAFLCPFLSWRQIFLVEFVEGFYVAMKVAQYIPLGLFAIMYIPLFALSGTWSTYFVYWVYSKTKIYNRVKNMLGGLY